MFIINDPATLLIFVAHLNCVLEHRLVHAQPEGAQTSLVLADSTDSIPPVGTPTPSDHQDCEHGCICKGATLAEHFVLTDFGSSELHFFFVALQSPNVWSAAPLFEANPPPLQSGLSVPLRASDRCALLQSFLI